MTVNSDSPVGDHAEASVIVRTFNSERTLAHTLSSLRAQTVRSEIVVVDSGSTDGTLQIAKRADRLVSLSHAEFSYGGSLNRGVESASGQVLFALSSHCAATDPQWIEQSLRHYVREEVAGTCGQRTGPSGEPLEFPIYQRWADPDPNPFWGFSNHASSWRRSIWREYPFDERLRACEDLAWSRTVRSRGMAIAIDPTLFVSSAHRKEQGVTALYVRAHKEAEALIEIGALRPLSFAAVTQQWWSARHHPGGTKPYRQRLSPYRTATLAARYTASQRTTKLR